MTAPETPSVPSKGRSRAVTWGIIIAIVVVLAGGGFVAYKLTNKKDTGDPAYRVAKNVEAAVESGNRATLQSLSTGAGKLRVFSGSRSPRVGFNRRLAIPVLACMRVKSKMLTPVVSLPVPAVVGIAISGFNGPGMGKPFPIGGFT